MELQRKTRGGGGGSGGGATPAAANGDGAGSSDSAADQAQLDPRTTSDPWAVGPSDVVTKRGQLNHVYR